ncbi:probable adenylate kinase 7, mitochondrial isoform X1 [Zingiber officinale]|uniref:probable adenylate kinase 7, mitochondrial isoform X1 n=1 Tax=Zingiber officinale TaxID=94328 RepID=UPI001C4B90CC|nr:probable adenylate kinase 7, mitochondrial isoform X1 [Zingiber officinale]
MAAIHNLLTSISCRSFSRRMATSLRSFASAALAEVDYWTEWEEVEEKHVYSQRASAVEEVWGERKARSVQWVFMGSPDVAQRHVLSMRVAELLDVPYISMGSLVRKELNPNSSLYKKISNDVNNGRLVPEEIIFGLLSKRLEERCQRGESGFILGGIPRTTIQAEILDQLADIDLVVNLKCAENCLVKKHFEYHICPHCGKVFDSSNSESTCSNSCLTTCTCHALLKPSLGVDMKDQRMEKIHVYTEQFKLLEEYYKKQKKLLEVQVTGGARETWQGLLAALHLQHMDTASSSLPRIN